MRCSLRRAIPGVVMLRQGLWRRYAFFRDDPFEGCKPMAVVGFSGVGIAVCLRLLDLLAKLRGPLGPGEETSIVQRYRHSKRVGFPGLAENRTVRVAWNAGNGLCRAPGCLRLNGRIFRHVRDKVRTLRWRLLPSGPHPLPKVLGRRSA